METVVRGPWRSDPERSVDRLAEAAEQRRAPIRVRIKRSLILPDASSLTPLAPTLGSAGKSCPSWHLAAVTNPTLRTSLGPTLRPACEFNESQKRCKDFPYFAASGRCCLKIVC